MGNDLIKKNFKDIANSIRSKTGENGLITPEEMPSKIESIQTGGTGTIEITTNGEHDVAQYGVANVNVPNPSSGTLDITANGTYDVKNYAFANVSGIPFKNEIRLTTNGHGFDVHDYTWGVVDVDEAPRVDVQTESFEYASERPSVRDAINPKFIRFLSKYEKNGYLHLLKLIRGRTPDDQITYNFENVLPGESRTIKIQGKEHDHTRSNYLFIYETKSGAFEPNFTYCNYYEVEQPSTDVNTIYFILDLVCSRYNADEQHNISPRVAVPAYGCIPCAYFGSKDTDFENALKIGFDWLYINTACGRLEVVDLLGNKLLSISLLPGETADEAARCLDYFDFTWLGEDDSSSNNNGEYDSGNSN